MYQLIDGKALSEKILNNLKEQIKSENVKAHLVVIIVGSNPASEIYVKNKAKCAENVGIKSTVINMPKRTTQAELEKKIKELNNDKDVTAILVQLPLPKHINSFEIIKHISPEKDVDGFHPENIGKLLIGETPYAIPCTPLGIIRILDEYKVELEGKNVVIVGRSNIVGKPLAALMLKKNATVTVCHSKTQNLKDLTKQADILICAIGKPHFFDETYVKDNAVIIDVGINRDENGKIVGDVNFENASPKASLITPVPKGVGPMTIAMLMSNTVKLAKKD